MRLILSACIALIAAICPPAFAIKFSGTVTRAVSGTPLAGLPVQVMRISTNTGNLVTYTAASTTTDVAGAFTTPIDLPAGQYWLRVPNRTTATNGAVTPTGYEGLYYHPAGNRPNRDPLSPIVVSSNILPAFIFSLRSAFAITGTVSAAGATNYALVDFDAIDASTGDTLALIDANAATDGTFAIYGFPAGAYYVRCDPDPTMGLYPVYQGNRFLESDAAPIALSNAAVSIHFTLNPGARISGSLYDAGDPVVDTDIDIYLVRSNRLIFVSDSARSGTNPPGSYITGTLAPGPYVMRADPAASSPYYLNYYTTNGISAPLSEMASLIAVGTSDVRAVDIDLFHGGFISGAVRYLGSGVSNINLDIYRSDGVRMEVGADSGSNGIFNAGALPPGSYIVRADPDPATGLLRTYFTNNYFIEESTSVPVIAGLVSSNIIIDAARGGFLHGRITDTNGAGMADIDLDVFDLAGKFMEGATATATDGYFLAGPYPSGQYTFRADPSARQFLCRTYYTGTLDSAQAQLVTIVAPATNSGLNMVLFPAGIISGFVRETNQITGIPAIDLDAYDYVTGVRVDASGYSGTDGYFEFGPVPPGAYTLRADPDAGTFWVREYYAETAIRTSAMPVVVLPLQVTSHISFTLTPGATIHGRILGLQSNPLAGVDLDVFPAGGGELLEQTALTDSNGYYDVGPVPLGSWAIRANPSAVSGLETRYYVSTGAISSAVPVVISATQDAVNINFVLGSNTHPVAMIGSFEGVSTGGVLALDAGASLDANGDRLLHRWRQISGPSVLFDNTNAARPLITLPPGVATGTLFAFELISRDFSVESVPRVIHFNYGPPAIRSFGRSGGSIDIDWTLGSDAQPYAIEASSNLSVWAPVYTGADTALRTNAVISPSHLRINAMP